MNGGTSNGGPLLEPHSDAEVGFVPLNIGPSSAEVPQQSAGASRPGTRFGRSPSLGRATSSKKCIIIAVATAVIAIALGVGLGVGLSLGGDGDDTGDKGDAAGSPSPSPSAMPVAPLSYRLMRSTGAATSAAVTELPQQCVDLATGSYFETLVPSQYDLTLALNGSMFTPDADTAAPDYFSASVTITFEVAAATSCVVLNAKDLNISRVEILSAGGDSNNNASAVLCEDEAGCAGGVVSAPFQRERETAGNPGVFEMVSTGDLNLVAINLGGTTFQPGTAKLALTYRGVIGNTLTGSETGLLRSAPFLANASGGGQYEALVYTQGAQNGGRQILPCYDQPRFKAAFTVNVQVPASLNQIVVLSNMLCDGRDFDPADPTVEIRQCSPTPPMSTYLLALAAGTMTPVELNARNLPAWTGRVPGAMEGQEEVEQWLGQLDVRVWTVRGALAGGDGTATSADFASLVAEPALAFYARFLNVSLGEMTKFDLLAVPGKSGAMENWGLLLFDERRFLYDKEVEGSYDINRAASVICHEIAHQWFGNLATKQDWTMTSVDEGLASYMEYKCMNRLGDLASSEDATMPGELADLVAAMKGQNVDLLKNTADVTFSRSSTPQLELPGTHDAPAQLALLITADPTHPPAVQRTDLTIGTGSYAQYAKPALLLRMYEMFLDELAQALNVDRNANGLPAVLGQFLRAHAGGTWNWGDFFKAAYDTTLATAGGDPKAPIPNLVAARSRTMWDAKTWDENRALVQAAMEAEAGDDSHATMAAWFYSSAFPIFSFADGQSLNATSYLQTTQSFGLTSRPFCAFNITSADVSDYADVDGVETLANEAAALCRGVQAGNRFFPSTLAFDQLVACSQDDFKTGNWTAGERWAQLSHDDGWVDNHLGARLFRSVYNTSHLTFLIGQLANMTDICDDGVTVDANDTIDRCCTRQSDLLEGAALLSDAAAVAMSENPVTLLPSVQLTVTAVLGHLEEALQGGDKSNGQWQYLIGGAAADVLFNIKRMDEHTDGIQCSADFAAYITEQLQPVAEAVADEWLPAMGEPEAVDPPRDLLKQLAGPRLLWQVGILDSQASDVTDRLCNSVPRTPWFRRYLLPRALDLDTTLDVDLSTVGFSYNATDGTPMEANGTPLSPDLLPALYMAAASFPPACVDAMSSAVAPALAAARGANATSQNATARAVQLDDVLAALQDCYLREVGDAEAQRCMYALPVLAQAADEAPVAEQGASHAAVDALTNDVLPWLLGTLRDPAFCATLSLRNGTDSRALRQLCAQRSLAAAAAVPALLTNAARLSSYQHQAVLTYLADNWDTLVPAGVPVCGLLEALPPPATDAANTQLMAVLTAAMGKESALGCPAATYVRAVGKAKQFQMLLANQAQQVCSHVAAKVA